MPLTKKGQKVKAAFEKEYGAKGESIYYAYENKNKGKGLAKGKRKRSGKGQK